MKSIFCHKAKAVPPAANTLRFEFSNQNYNPVTAGVGSSGTWKRCEFMPGNVWDWTRNNSSWSSAFDEAFQNPASIGYIDVIDAGDTSSVTNMSSLFRRCTAIRSLCLFDTSNVTSFRLFASRCSIERIPLYNTGKVTNLDYAFYFCTMLKVVPLFDTSKATSVSFMFQDCLEVESGALDLYTKMSTQTTLPATHSLTFSNCGRDTETGAAELAQIPQSWGGTKEEA